MITVWLAVAFFLQISPELRQHVEAGLKAKAADDLETAAREFRRVVELAPDLPAAHVNLGAVYLAQKDYGGAIVSLRRALARSGNLPAAHGMLGTALLAQGFVGEAVPHLQKGRLDDLLGVALLEADRPREALPLLEAALARRPDDPDLLYYLGQAHGHLSRQLFERLQAAHSGSPRARQAAGEALLAAGDRQAAEGHLRAVLAARPELGGVHLLLGQVYAGAGDYTRATGEFAAEVRMAPGSAEAAYRHGAALLQLGQLDEAIGELTRAEALLPGMPETLLELGRARAATGETAAAVAALERVATAEGSTRLAEAATFQLIPLYRKLKRPADAERARERFEALRKAAR